jgi:hypothetical protein
MDDIQVDVEASKLTVRFQKGAPGFISDWSPALSGVERLTKELQALDKAPGWQVRATAQGKTSH